MPTLLLTLALGGTFRARGGTEAPGALLEVYGLLRSNLTGVSEAELDAAAVRGLVQPFAPRATLVTNPPAGETAVETGPTITRTNVFDHAIGYLRVARVAPGLASALESALSSLATNQLDGLVLDLRYAGGWDYAEAARTADWFVPDERPLLHWGTGSAKSTAKTNAFTQPVVALVNAQTAGAAEALAAVLRDTRAGLIIGAKTAGEASVFREFTLSDGQRLRIATAPVQVGDGQTLGAAGLTPDIRVTVPPADEKAFFANAYYAVPRPAGGNSATNEQEQPMLNEAELVRLHREGLDPEDPDAPLLDSRPATPKRPTVTDPALARGLDLLKALAVVRHSQH